MRVLRTPDERFEGLKDYPFSPHYREVANAPFGPLRMHYLDEGPAGGRPVLRMHGEPSWSYLYRKIAPALAGRGLRAVAPDLIGFGRSDKPADPDDYTYERHVAWTLDWFLGLDLRDVILFCQDWGGLIGLRLLAAHPERFAGAVVSNTGLPTGSGFSEAFAAWLAFSQSAPILPVSAIVNGGTVRDLSEAELAAYDAPYPDESFKAGARRFPALVPITPDHASVRENIAAWTVLEQFSKPVIAAFSDADPVTRGGETIMRARIPGAAGQPAPTLKGGHFVQEDAPDDIVQIICDMAARL